MSDLRAADPRSLGAYRLSARLGQGGQGVVYLGHTGNGAQVAIKLLHAGLSTDPAVRRRFRDEVEAVRRVAPFCTAQLLDAGLEDDRPYLVSEYVDGISLSEHVLAQGPRAGGSLHRLAIGTATALGAIHRAAVVHRDFKPGNVLLSLDGPRVIDFGISRPMESTATTGRILGTPAYLPPERIKGEPAGPPGDLYAWALTVAYTANGRHAYTAGTHQEVLARILYGRPDLGVLTGRLRELVDACLAPEPRDRPDAEEVLRRLLDHDMTGGDVLSTGARAALDTAAAEPTATVAWRTPNPPDGPTPQDGTRPSAGRSAAGRPSGGRCTGGRSPSAESTDARSALAALVDTSGSAAGRAEASVAAEPSSFTRPWDPVRPASAPASVPAPMSITEPGESPPGEPPPVSVADLPPAGRGRRPWVLAVVAVVLGAAVAGVVFWAQGADGSTDGVWTGSAVHPSAGRVFPVEIRLRGDRESSMRWGADLHCSGLLSPAGGDLVFELGEVDGAECYPGTLRLLPTRDTDQMAISVTRQGEPEVTYSGRVSRTP